jgi:hypothetical protein
MASRQLAPEKNIVIHTWKDAWSGRSSSWHPIDYNILKFWASISFVKGIVFDMDQRNPIQTSSENSLYHVHIALSNLYDDKFSFNIKDSIDFSSLPRFESNGWKRNILKRNKIHKESKIAVFQPVSFLHKEEDKIESDYTNPWDECLRSLLDKGYEIIVIGSNKDNEDVKKYYPNLLTKYPMRNLMGRINMFESIDLVINHASFVLSCDSWSGWYGIASRKKTAVAASKIIGAEFGYVLGLGNKDIYELDYSHNKEKCDANLAEWIKNNA